MALSTCRHPNDPRASISPVKSRRAREFEEGGTRAVRSGREFGETMIMRLAQGDLLEARLAARLARDGVGGVHVERGQRRGR